MTASLDGMDARSVGAPPTGSGGSTARHTLSAIRAGLVVLNLLVVLICGVLLWRGWETEIREVRDKTASTATLLERSASATFDKIKIALKNAADQVERQLTGPGLDQNSLLAVLDKSADAVPEIDRIRLFDAAGQQICGLPVARCQHIDISDRDYFARLRQQPDAPAMLVGPLSTKTDKLPAVFMVQALRTPTRAFAGVVVAVVLMDALKPLVSVASFGPNGAASLRTSGMELLVRSNPLPAFAARVATTTISDRLAQGLVSSPQGSSYRAVSAVDGIDRVVTYRKLPDYPVYALVGEATDDFLVDWRDTVAWTSVFMALFMAATLAIERVAAASLRQQERAQRLYDEAPCAYHTLDADGRYLSINATELRWLGCRRDEAIGKLSPADFLTGAGRATFASNFPKLRQTGRLDEVEVDLVGRHGEVRRVLVSARVVADASGQFQLVNTVMHDITLLNAARAQLAAQAAEQQAMLDSELVGMLRVRAGIIVWKNRGMDHLFGYGGDEWQGMPEALLFASEGAWRQVDEHRGALTRSDARRDGRNDRKWRRQLELKRKDGTLVWIDISSSTLDGTANGAESFSILIDISEQKKAEAARLRGAELEAHNVSLREAGRLKDEFLSNISHELRTPLNAVIGYTQLLQMSTLDAHPPKHANYIRRIDESAKHLLGLVQTMLAFAESASGKLVFASQPLSVQAALEEVDEILEPDRRAANVALTICVETGLHGVVTDPVRLRQMLRSLVGNAVKFSRPGGSVQLRAFGVDDTHWCVEVEDQGIGISEADLQRLFGTFVQLSAGSTKAYGGTGLGLALVRKMAHAQGGEVQVRSQLGLGSIFTLILPRVLTATPEARLVDANSADMA